MNRREVLGALGATAVGLAAVTGGKVYADEKGGGGEHDEMAKKCAKSCSDCANDCNAGFHHCHQQLAAGKKEYAMAEHLCCDTAEVCSCTAACCARMSPLMGICCDCCAKCCDACIKECEKLDDPELKKVVEACRKAAKSCREMVTAMGGK